MTASGARIGPLPPDRGPRQYQKMMQVLAAVMANGDRPLVDRCSSTASAGCAAA